MTKEIAIEIIRIYEKEKREVEKDKTSEFWSPVSTAGYYSNYRAVVDGEEYSLVLTGVDGHPP